MAHSTHEWKKIVGAIEDSIPVYESISERISFNLAGPLRRRAISKILTSRRDWVLDSGAGPGVSSRLLISYGFVKVVGLDPSRRLLKFARTRLGPEFYPVVGVAENLPFKQQSFGSTLTCFALRDVKDPRSALTEFARVVEKQGQLCIVDIGKPDMVFKRTLIGLYVRLEMPLLARLLIRNRIRGNPFRMIVPTFDRLVSNERLVTLVSTRFGPSTLSEPMFGGLVLVYAKRSNASLV